MADGTCRHCGRPIVFVAGSNIWRHENGERFCHPEVAEPAQPDGSTS